MTRNFLRWFLYIIVVIFSYCIQITIPFLKWQPLLIITVASAVAIFESELSSFIFGAFCGFMCDLATGGLFGFTAIWLTPCCLFITLMSVNLIHRNLINYLWLDAATLLIIDFMELLFKHFIWRDSGVDIYFINYLLPSGICTIILSSGIYGIVFLIHKKFRTDGIDSDVTNHFISNNDDFDGFTF